MTLTGTTTTKAHGGTLTLYTYAELPDTRGPIPSAPATPATHRPGYGVTFNGQAGA